MSEAVGDKFATDIQGMIGTNNHINKLAILYELPSILVTRLLTYDYKRFLILQDLLLVS